MRKYFLGLVIGAVFLAYSLVLRHQHSGPIIAPTSLSQNTSSTPAASSTDESATTTQYKDGTYTGSIANAFYGNVQVSATISGGKITAVDFIQAPDENPNSIYVNQQADPYLKEEAIKAQSAHVDVITGATLTSDAFMQSLSNALSQAKQS